MKLKYFIRGLGVGIIFTAIILAIVLKNPAEKPLSDEDIKTRAVQLGMVSSDEIKAKEASEAMKKKEEQQKADAENLVKEEQKANTENPVKKEEQKADTENPVKKEEQKADTENPVKKEEQKVDTENPVKKTENKTTDKSESEKKEVVVKPKPQIISVTIKSGMFSNHTAKELQRVGIVKDAKKFDQYLIRNGYQSKIMTGTYQISPDASYEQIAKAITK